MNKNHSFFTRVTAMLLALVCVLGLLPATALAAPPDTVKLEDCTYNGVQYDSPALGTCRLQQMRFDRGGKSAIALHDTVDSPAIFQYDIALVELAEQTLIAHYAKQFHILAIIGVGHFFTQTQHSAACKHRKLRSLAIMNPAITVGDICNEGAQIVCQSFYVLAVLHF